MRSEARQLVREGIVCAVFPERHSARVTFNDKDALTSAELPVLTSFALENKCYALPAVGEQVVCLFAANADQTGTGWIIGSRYNDKATPTVNSQDITRLDFKDGTFISYDRARHELRVECVGNVVINGREVHLN